MQMSGVQIQLNSESSFKYEYVGHIVYDTVRGRFEVYRDTILFTFLPQNTDSVNNSFVDTTY